MHWVVYIVLGGEIVFQPLSALGPDSLWDLLVLLLSQPFLSLKWPYLRALLSLFILLPSIHPPYSCQTVTCSVTKIFYHHPNHGLKYKLIFFEHLLICQVLWWALGIQRLVRQNCCSEGAPLASGHSCRLRFPTPWSRLRSGSLSGKLSLTP